MLCKYLYHRLYTSICSLRSTTRACHIAGAEWIHIDVCDGGSMAPGALTVGAGTVAAIRKAGKCRSVRYPSNTIFIYVFDLSL